MEYIIQTNAGMRIDFPPNKFGFNDLEAKLVKEKNKDIGDDVLKSMIKPFPHLKFFGQYTVSDEPSIEKPWTIKMVRDTQAYKDGKVWELSNEQQDQIRKSNPYPSLVAPENFKKNIHEYIDGIEFLKKPFKGKKKEECDEYLLTLKKVIGIYRIVNLTIPQEQENIEKYAKLLEASRVQIESLLEELV
jgi:hypothetical protein